MEASSHTTRGVTGPEFGFVAPQTDDDSAISRLLVESRRSLDRVGPEDLAAELAAGAMVVDTRPSEQRNRDGHLPGAVVVDRNVLEWRLDPTSPSRLEPDMDPQRRIIIVCNEGYSSSLAARTLRELGLSRATDLAGGYQAWLCLGPSASNDKTSTPQSGT